jgi:tripartite-type tricarboxylate transporter receptor subunit TctC
MKLAQHALASAAALSIALGAPTAYAQGDYPNKPVRIVVGYQPGGPTDVAARLLATQLQASLGQPFLVENKPGAASNIASELVARSPADGYTLLLAAAPITMTGFLYKNLKWDVQKSFEPVSLVMSAPAVLAVAPNAPAKNLKDLIALAKKQPGTLTFGSTGSGGSQHVAGEMLKQQAGIDIVHVPYKGASGALQDLMAGRVTMAFMTSVSAVPYLKEGKIHPIAVAASKRLPQLPDVPTMSEAGLPGFESDSWNGLFAPKGTPPAIIAKLHTGVVKAVSSPEMRNTLGQQGAVLVGNTPAEFQAVIKEEVDDWGKLFQTLSIKLD